MALQGIAKGGGVIIQVLGNTNLLIFSEVLGSLPLATPELQR